MKRSITKFALAGAAVLAAVGAGASGAEAAVSCSSASGVVTVRLTAHQDHATLIVKPENQAIRIEGTSQVGMRHRDDAQHRHRADPRRVRQLRHAGRQRR